MDIITIIILTRTIIIKKRKIIQLKSIDIHPPQCMLTKRLVHIIIPVHIPTSKQIVQKQF